MEEKFYFVYTRTLRQDYQAMYFPSDIQCPRKKVFNNFMNLARGVINTDHYEINLDKPVWLLAKQDGYTLWGIGVMNLNLSPDYCRDYTGTPIRGFFGLIYKGIPDKLPYELSFFKSMYEKRVVPYWEADAFHCFHEGVSCDDMDIFEYTTISAAEKGVTLNKEAEKSLIIGSVDVNDAISQALYEKEVSGIVIGLQTESHAFSNKYKFPNIWIEGVNRKEYVYKNPVNIQDDHKTKDDVHEKAGAPDSVNSLNVFSKECSDWSKKAIDPKYKLIKIIIIVIAILFAVILIMLCR